MIILQVFDKKYVDHMRRIHKLTLKIFGLSFRCILCSTQFNDYNTFSSHAHTTHNIPKDREIYK